MLESRPSEYKGRSSSHYLFKRAYADASLVSDGRQPEEKRFPIKPALTQPGLCCSVS